MAFWDDIPRKPEYLVVAVLIIGALIAFNHTPLGTLVGDLLAIPTGLAIFWAFWRFGNRR